MGEQPSGRWGRHQPPTLRAVAEAAHCSTATVSRALNGGPVSADRLAQVNAAVDALGYVPNVAARNVRGIQTRLVGIIMNFEVHPGTELLNVLASLITEMEAGGYTCVLSLSSQANDDPNGLLRRFAELRVAGVFYWNARWTESLRLYAKAGIPVIAIGGRDERCARLPLITTDASAALHEAFSLLHSLGHRKVVEIAPASAPTNPAHRAAAKKQRLAWRSHHLAFDYSAVIDFISALHRASDAPTAVLAQYPTALQMLEACSELGLSVPGDISLIALSDTQGARLLKTPLSAIRTDFDELGRGAARAMLSGLSGRRVKDVVMEGVIEWVPRASVGPVRESVALGTELS